MKFSPVSSQVNLPELEEETIQFWKENNIFERSVNERPEDNRYTFYDGPPFITGLPHYGTLLPSIVKDVFPRYQTMLGKRVRRVWGWDCHGLPAENKVEEKLGIRSKREIEELGIDKFIAECRAYVSTVSSEWNWYIDRVGRWVDMEHAYKTMDLDYMETVMGVFKQIYDKGLIYKGRRSALYCTRCSTQLSNFEIAMDNSYRDVQDPSVYVKFPVKGKENVYFLVWTTTPWTLPSNLALAVNPDEEYVAVDQDGEHLILAKKLVEKNFGSDAKIVKNTTGKDLIGWEYQPLYTFFETGESDYKVYDADFVSMDDGTGIVHIAPAFGEDDYKFGQEHHLSFIEHVDDAGKITDKVEPWKGLYIKKADPLITEDLQSRGLLFKTEVITHSYPFCYRCGTPLIYRALESWFLKVSQIKDQMLASNKNINWVPKHMKTGRFQKGIESAPDWNLSRSRYWGSPLPIWECQCGERYVPGSIAELEQASGQKVNDLHRPEIDQVEVNCSKCGKKAKRVKDVLDCWFESGSMPYTQPNFPADFITEYIAQTRGWFYTLHVISNALKGSECFENVVVTGTLMGSDGRKMSKLFGNYPDPKMVLEKYGADALRLYLMGSPVMRGEDMNFYEEGVADNYRFLLTLWNTYKFFTDYAALSGWQCEDTLVDTKDRLTVLDKWILSRLTQLTQELRKAYDTYDVVKVTSLTKEFLVDDFSTWYIRRCRDRVTPENDSSDRTVVLSVMYGVLVTFTKLSAPLIPFIAEKLFKGLTGEESVHLQMYPQGDSNLLNQKLNQDMATVRQLATVGHGQRKEQNLKLRQPLASFKYKSATQLDSELEDLLAEELNVKKVEYSGKADQPTGEIDGKLTPELEEEGKVRDLIRQIQVLRKESGLTLADKIEVVSEFVPENKELADLILRQTNATKLSSGDKLSITTIG